MIKDMPSVKSAYIAGQISMMKGEPLTQHYQTVYEQEEFERGYMFEKSDWETRPPRGPWKGMGE